MSQLEDLPTPVALIDEPTLRRNIVGAQRAADALGVRLRPHIKTHKSSHIALEQLKAGASGLTVATLTEAETMARAGATDILFAYPPVGSWRLRRLAALLERAHLTFVVDGLDAARALSKVAVNLGTSFRCRWEIDCGAERCGTRPGAETVDVASAAFALPGLDYCGFFTFPGQAYASTTEDELENAVAAERHAVAETTEMARKAGFPEQITSGGTTPTFARLAPTTNLGEVRPGNYVFNDATQVALDVATVADCAFSVLATVVGRPRPDRLILDAGSKAIAKDVMTPRTSGYAIVKGHPGVVVSRLYEEHAIVDLPDSAAPMLDVSVGDRVEIVPNHACVAANLHRTYIVRDGDLIVDEILLDARGEGPS